MCSLYNIYIYIHNEHNYICTQTNWELYTCLLLYTPDSKRVRAQYLNIPTLHCLFKKERKVNTVYVEDRMAVIDVAVWPRKNYRTEIGHTITRQ